jgi:hypothetical protein
VAKSKKYRDPIRSVGPEADDTDDDAESAESRRSILVELRGAKHQTVVAPSLHPSGEPYVWHSFEEPARIEARDLERIVAEIAAAALLTRYWPPRGVRHELSVALAGGLLRAGWTDDRALRFLRAVYVAAKTGDVENKLAAIRTTRERLEAGEETTGWPSVVEVLGQHGDAIVGRVRKWLNLSAVVRVPEVAPEPPKWPDPPGEEAFSGLAGEIVRAIEPTSESDKSALLVQTLVAFGNVIGRTAHFVVEGDRHHGNEFVVLVGRTAKARKGTSWGRIERLFREAEEQWATERLQTGLSSGEGLIWAVRDPITKRERVKERGQPVHYEEVEADPGIQDKRLQVFEPEFANVLKQTERQGNTLSAILRNAWDGRDLRSMTKNSPARATGAHVSLIGHITSDELHRYLSETETANGFANRFLFVCVDRSKVLPEGGKLDLVRWEKLRAESVEVLDFARSAGEYHRDEEARAIWHEVYAELSEGKPGLAGALLARGEAHVMRLALLYAVLDKSPVIRAQHLLAALALWVLCERSVYYVFGDRLGDPLADDLLRLLRSCPEGLTRTDVSSYLGRHQSAERIGRALGLLLQHKLARCDRQETGGRPTEQWFAIGKPR